MARVGVALAETDPGSRRIVVGVALPTRGFAAALAAASYVLRRNQLDPIEPSDADAHFAALRQLAEGTPIKLMQGGRLHDGRLLGVEVREGAELLKVETRGMTRFLPRTLALDVRPAHGIARETDLRSRKIDVPPLLAGLVERRDAHAYATQSRIDTVLVGTLTALTADLTAAEFSVAGQPKSVGCLQDLVRARDVAGAASGHRSALVAAGADEDTPDEDDSGEVRPGLVVFDGGRGYERLGHKWRGSLHLIVIDRSQPSAGAAAEALNLAYFERIDEHDLRVGECPASMEFTAFEASRG